MCGYSPQIYYINISQATMSAIHKIRNKIPDDGASSLLRRNPIYSRRNVSKRRCDLTGEDGCGALRRRFARGFLDLLILRRLKREPLWGYRMMSMLRTEHGVRVGPPIIYPMLGSMEADGLVESEEVYEGKRRRKVYHATQKGLDLVKCFEAVLSEILEDSEQSG